MPTAARITAAPSVSPPPPPPPSPSPVPNCMPSPMSARPPPPPASPTTAPPCWTVHKYGGTSVGKFLGTIVRDIVPAAMASACVDSDTDSGPGASGCLAAVCSARSGDTKAHGTTNLLLQAASQALAPAPRVPDSPSVSASASLAPPPAESDSQYDVRASTTTTSMGMLAPAAAFEATVAHILLDHVQAARAHVRHAARLAQLEAELRDDCARLRDILLAARVIGEISVRTRDAILSLGERMSCRIVAAALTDAGTPATLVTLESVVAEQGTTPAPNADDAYIGADAAADAVRANGGGALSHAFFQRVAARLGARLRALPPGQVAVVTGHFGPVPGGMLEQVGRGYTDLCAALCAVGVQAAELQIWKEVDGVFTADPRTVPSARLLPAISPEEAAELTHYGAEVIHSLTMEHAIRNAIPIRIKNVTKPSDHGTLIVPTQAADHGVDGHVAQPKVPLNRSSGSSSGSSSSNSSYGGAPLPALFPEATTTAAAASPAASSVATSAASSAAVPGSNVLLLPGKKRRLPTAVTIKDDIVVLNVHSNRKTHAPDFYARIFGVMDRWGVPVDLIATSRMHVSMAVSASHRHLPVVWDALGALGTVSVLRDMALVSLIGREMRHLIGIAGKMFSTLADGSINIELISQGAAEISISVAVHKAAAVRAINLIHEAVLEVPAPPIAGHFGRSFF